MMCQSTYIFCSLYIFTALLNELGDETQIFSGCEMMVCGQTIGFATSVTVWTLKKPPKPRQKHAEKNKVKYLLLAVKILPSS